MAQATLPRPANADDLKKVNELIKDIRIAMMTTVEADGSLRSRPMATQEAEFDGDLWFFSHETAPKVDEIHQDRRVNLSYAGNKENTWVSVSGTASVVRDRATMDAFWNPALKAWFPEGLDDPDLALLKVDVEQAEYWDTSSSKIVHAVGFVKAIATGKQYEPGDNEKLDLQAV
ncbi:MAG: General stress protein [uncultured Thermomicrobiales bacterium]|uniref:General stress protein n=1 Tax=uncultured Thermomicrobiales bacterium TaxID=1645740 RepID=A0A6J4U0I0_9BACT|nr:MAG: General stress protein [uncultured Thermomicrobiales bacterium]